MKFISTLHSCCADKGVLMVRAFVAIFLSLSFVFAYSAEQKERQTAKPDQKSTSEQRGTEKFPVIVKSASPSTDAEREHDAYEKHQKPWNETALTYATIALSGITLALAIFTALLWFANRSLVKDSKKAANAARDSADAAIKAAMPVLQPLIYPRVNLHPLQNIQGPFVAYAHFVFENFGKSIGIVREVKASLVLNVGDDFKIVPESELRPFVCDTWVPPNFMGEQAFQLPIVECEQTFTLTPVESNELLAEASAEKYRRFALVGRVVYDDLFGMRHTRIFYIKLRLKPDGNLFQVPRGGQHHNRITSEKIPNPDPLAEL